ncbi:MAG TPA: epoxide hydrolase [Gaiellaceae bacterium]|nr:epoxide hydrolase [Gaiellaceae bacterium]
MAVETMQEVGERVAGGVISPFKVSVPDAEPAKLRDRIAATRWPSRELVDDWSQGVRLAMLQELARYWAEEYDFGRLEARLNALPQFTTEIDGVDIHFIHVRSQHEDAMPLIITHGWPGSVIEMLDVIGPLTDPTAYGGNAEDAFDVVIPSIPGYGFSSQPAEVGWDSGRIASAWAELMSRLGYTRYVAQGGDQGAGVTDAMGRQAPDGLLGVHFNFLDAVPKELLMAALNIRLAFSHDDREQLSKVVAIFMRGYIAEMGEHPQTIGYSLLDSPVGLAAWMLDHDADSYEKISSAFLDGQPSGGLTRDAVLDNITLYWLTSTGASTSRIYWETGRAAKASFKNPPPHVKLPVAYTVFPDELFQAPQHWVKHAYHNLVYYNEAPKGGHFAAWEEPEIFAQEMRAAFASLR